MLVYPAACCTLPSCFREGYTAAAAAAAAAGAGAGTPAGAGTASGATISKQRQDFETFSPISDLAKLLLSLPVVSKPC